MTNSNRTKEALSHQLKEEKEAKVQAVETLQIDEVAEEVVTEVTKVIEEDI